MVTLTLAISAIAAVGCAWLAQSMARKRNRHRGFWAAATVAMGVVLLVVELYIWERPQGDAASFAGFDMQILLPSFGMLGTAFVLHQLPSKPTRVP